MYNSTHVSNARLTNTCTTMLLLASSHAKHAKSKTVGNVLTTMNIAVTVLTDSLSMTQTAGAKNHQSKGATISSTDIVSSATKGSSCQVISPNARQTVLSNIAKLVPKALARLVCLVIRSLKITGLKNASPIPAMLRTAISAIQTVPVLNAHSI